jgi:HEAT repeat protein/beta-lactamase regulating signal transducer with metallopeptidase domain
MISLFDLSQVSELGWHFIAASLRGTLILMTAAAICLALRRASAAMRHFVWSLALISLMALPLLSIGLPAWQIALLPAPVDSASNTTYSPAIAQPFPAPITNSRSLEKPLPSANEPTIAELPGKDVKPLPAGRETSPRRFESLGWVSWAFAIWLAGALFISGRLLIGIASIWWIARRATLVTDAGSLKMARDIAAQIGLTRQAPMFKTARAAMPVTCGLIRPRILLPADSDTWPDERRQVVLLHELAHVKRWDCLTQLLGQLACSIYWFNPLVWLASRQLRVERERACDDQVIEVGTRASDYAGHLLDMARTFRSGRCSSLATLAIARRSQLEGRLLAILDPGLRRRGLNRIAAIGVGVFIVCVVLPIASVRLSSKASANKLSVEEVTPTPRPEPANLGSARLDSLVAQPEPQQSAQEPQPAPDKNNTQFEAPQPDQEGSGGTVAQQKDHSAVIEALRDALKDEDSKVREQALFALSQIDDPPALAALVEALKDQSWQVRANAANALGLRGGRNGVDALVGALKDTTWQVREQAAWALGLAGDARAIDPLIDALRDESSEVREKAAWALGLKGNKRSVEPLMTALKDTSASVRGMAAWALGLKSDSRAGDALKEALKDSDKAVRQKAAWALGMLLMKFGGAPTGLPDSDDRDDTESEFSRGGVPGRAPGRVGGGIPGGVPGGVPPGGGTSAGVPGGVATFKLTKPAGPGPWTLQGTGRGTGSGVGAGAGGGIGVGIDHRNKTQRPNPDSRTKSKTKQK